MKAIQNGIWSGILATDPMTSAMLIMRREMPADQKSPLPPSTITNEIISRAGLQNLPTARKEDLTLISHFGYGAACGLIYALSRSLIPEKEKEVSPLLTGAIFCLSVWGFSYMVGNPSTGLRASAQKMPAKRNAMMILAHLVWGASLGYAENELRRAGDEILVGQKRSLFAE